MELKVVFYRSGSGREPVRDWLLGLDRDDMRTIGEDLKTVQLGWPLGMPLVRSLGKGLWELRSSLKAGTARVFFLADEGRLIVLHAFVKKTQKTPDKELDLARRRMTEVLGG